MRFLALLLFVLLLALAACKTYLLFYPASDGSSPCYDLQARIYRNGDVIITTDDYKKTIDTVLTDGVNIKYLATDGSILDQDDIKCSYNYNAYR